MPPRTQISILLGIVTLLGGLFALFSVTSAATCHTITQSSQTPTGYASPVSFFSNDLMIKGDCNSNSIAVTVGNGEPTTYVYDKSYLWTGSQWSSKTLQGTNKQGVWIPKEATTNLISTQNPTYYVAYTCQWINSSWKCGCTTQSCTQNQWQLQMFQTQSSNQGGGGYTGGNGTQECPLKNDLFLNPFNKDSAHHRPIGTGAQYVGTNHAATKDWLQNGNGTIGFNVGAPFGVSVFPVTDSGPIKTVRPKQGCGNTRDLPITMKFPSQAINVKLNNNEGGCGDGMVALLDTSSKEGHQLRSFDWNNGSPLALQHFEWGLQEEGHGTSPGDRRGTSASGITALFGLLRGEEINTPGRPIQHALQISLPWNKPGSGSPCQAMLKNAFIAPAVSVDSNAPNYSTGNIPYGALLAIPPESKGGPNLDSLGLSESGRRLAQALRDYGAYAVDSTHCPNVRTDQFVKNTAQLKEDMKKIYQYMRMVTNSAWTPGQSAVGGGQPLAPNCAFDA